MKTYEGSKMKVCPDCPPGADWHHEEAFYRRATSKDGLDLYCKNHRRERTNKWRQENTDSVREYNRQRTLQSHAEKVFAGERSASMPSYKGVRESTYDRADVGEVTVYYARITVKGHRYTIQNEPGIFQFYTPEDAARAYDAEIDRLGLNRVRNRDLYPALI